MSISELLMVRLLSNLTEYQLLVGSLVSYPVHYPSRFVSSAYMFSTVTFKFNDIFVGLCLTVFSFNALFITTSGLLGCYC